MENRLQNGSRFMCDHWNLAWDQPPSSERAHQIKIVEHLLRGNFHWFVRQLLGNPKDTAYGHHAMCEQSDWLRRTRELLNEDTIGQD